VQKAASLLPLLKYICVCYIVVPLFVCLSLLNLLFLRVRIAAARVTVESQTVLDLW
jgi:hypothetical protein